MRDALFPPTCPGPRLNPHKEPRARQRPGPTRHSAQRPRWTHEERGDRLGGSVLGASPFGVTVLFWGDMKGVARCIFPGT